MQQSVAAPTPHPPSAEIPGEGDEVANSQPDSNSAPMLLSSTNCKATQSSPTFVHGVKTEPQKAKSPELFRLTFESDPS